jgi:hypothetical protein
MEHELLKSLLDVDQLVRGAEFERKPEVTLICYLKWYGPQLVSFVAWSGQNNMEERGDSPNGLWLGRSMQGS